MRDKWKISYSLIFALILISDRITKLCALQFLSVTEYVVNSFLSFCLVFNRGIMGGFLGFHHNLFWIVTMAIMSVYSLLLMHAYQRLNEGYAIWGEMMVLAGGFGNILDRFYYQGVIDFVLLSYNAWHFPIFNVADMAIVMGVMYMFFFSVIRS